MTTTSESTARAEGARAANAPVRMTLVGKLAEGVALALLATLVPRVLGPTEYGQFALVLALVQVGATALALGGHTAMSRFVPAAPAGDRAPLARALTVRLALWRAPLFFGIAIVALALSVGLPDHVPPEIVGLALIALALDATATMLAQAGLGLGQTTLWSFRWPLQTTVLVVGALVLSVPWGTTGAVAAIPISAFVAFAWTAAAVAPTLRRARAGAWIPQGAMRVAVQHGVSFLVTLTVARAAIVVVALVAGAGASAEIGYAAVAVGIALAGVAAVTQIFTVQLGGLSEHVGAGLRSVEDEARRLARHALAVALPAALVGAALLEPLTAIVLGEEFRPATSALAWALAVLVLAPLSALTLQTSALRLRPGVRMRGALVSAVVFLAISFPLAIEFGAAGALGALYGGTLAAIGYELMAFRSLLDRVVTLAGIGGSAVVLVLGLT